MRRFLTGLVLSVVASTLLAAPAATASPLTDAQAKARALRTELQAATVELEAAEASLYAAEEQLAFDRRQLQATQRQFSEAQAVLAGQAAAMYRSGGLAMADAMLQHNPDTVPGRVELATLVVARQSETLADAKVAGDAYAAAVSRVAAGQRKANQLRDQAEEAVQGLTRRLREAEAVQSRLARLQGPSSPGTPPSSAAAPGGGRVACLMEAPSTYVDTWGAPRSGGRRHQGTDVMAPYRAKVYAFTDGTISRESSNTYGGITLYLQGDNGVEYYYAHLSGYAVAAGTRVKAGQLIAYNGQSGNARYTAPHVHFEVHPGGPGSSPVNPYPYVRQACG
ncbi:MAG TPA: peptidoglycan DD-metalloendopeptidase family protein [Actinomycetes bacterium]|nr:peptidoglycan DD-metalloendopeptidase family protein [Actinomycetes bacterium]